MTVRVNCEKERNRKFNGRRLLLRSFMENLLIDDCSESEGSGSKGDSGSGNEGGGTLKCFTRSTSFTDS